MAAITMDFAELKSSRSVQRNASLRRDREDYQRLLAKRKTAQGGSAHNAGSSVSASYRQARPHRGARTMTRSWLAKGEVQGEADMPSLSTGHVWRKPSVSRRHVFSETSCFSQPIWDEVSSDVDTTEPEGDDIADDNSSIEVSSATSGQELVQELDEVGDDLAEQLELEKAAIPQGSRRVEQLAPEDTVCEHQSQPKTFDSLSFTASVEHCEASLTAKADRTCSEADNSPAYDERARRERITRNVLNTLRHQVRQAECAAEEAKAQVQTAVQKTEAQHQKDEVAAKKLVLQTEKQRVAQLRKQRSQAAHLQAVKEKAERTLQEAAAIREQAEMEASSMRAQLLAEACTAATDVMQEADAIREQVETQVQAELIAAKAEAEILKLDSLESVRKAETIKAEAETEALALKMQANKERFAAAQTKAEAETLHAEAERTAQMIRKLALEDAVALKARAEAQLQQKVEAERKARQDAEEKLARESAALAAEAQCRAESIAKREASAALKLAKTMEQQRARKIRKQAEQERRQEEIKCNELEAIKAQAEEAQRMIKQQAFLEAAAMKAKAKAEAQAVRAHAIAAARVEAQETAHTEAAALRAEAEIVAESIKAKAVRDAEELMQQAEADLERTKVARDLKAAIAIDSAFSELEEDWHVLPAEVEDSDWDLLAFPS